MRFRIRWSALALVVTLAAEIAVFIVIGKLIGFGLAVLGVLVLMAVGAILLRQEGARTWRRFRAVTEAGERPGPHLSRALVGLVGGALLLVPGYLTALVGLALFLPPIRALASTGLTALAGRRLASAAMGDLFGPRQVKVRAGRATRNTGPADSVMTDTEPIEGEIVDPR
ncbi:MAG TPA: FxsA family protein [Micromonosporaceae bacterium]|nr:FxsA family protein [Micromonosporaceae bacterium]